MPEMTAPIAKARDEWFESKEGIECQDGEADGKYLRNRLEAAFIAGWNMAVALLETPDA